jgi:hypothetical protein
MRELLPATFNPRQVGHIEARLWHAYYARHWPRVVLLTFRLVRGQLGLSWRPAVKAVGHAARATIAWAPAQNDPVATRNELRAFYGVVAEVRGAAFDPKAVGDAEFDYWKIHRDLVGQDDRTPLVDSLARIPALLFDVPSVAVLVSATERERAVRLVDLITSGQQAPTDAAWHQIATSLVRSYELLRDEIEGCRVADS